MVSADTNVIVRLLIGDDQEKERKLFENEEIFIATSFVLECEWVFRYAYHFEEIADAIAWHKQGMDFADDV